MVIDALFRVLHFGKGRIVDPDTDHGASLGPPHSSEWDWTGSGIAEPAADLGPICPAMRANAVAPRHQPPRDFRGDAVYYLSACDDRSNDCSRRWSASGVGAVAAAFGDRVTGSRCTAEKFLGSNRHGKVQRRFSYIESAGPGIVHRTCYSDATPLKTIHLPDRLKKINHFAKNGL
jgi:hypothetical protein